MMKNLQWAALGSAALLLGFLGYRWFRPSPEADLFQAYFEPYPVPMSAPADPDLIHWLNAVANYNQGRFEVAQREFQLARAEQGIPAFMVEFYLGQSFLATDKPDSAVLCFDRVLQQNTGIQSLARWYMGLACLDAHDHSKAVHHFQILHEEQGYRSRDAGFLLQQIR